MTPHSDWRARRGDQSPGFGAASAACTAASPIKAILAFSWLFADFPDFSQNFLNNSLIQFKYGQYIPSQRLFLYIAVFIIIFFEHPYSAFIFLGLIGISNGFANVLGTSTWAEIYGVKYIGSIKALTTALMVFSTAFGTALFGVLIDKGYSIEQIALVSFSYIFFSILLLFIVRNKLNPQYISEEIT